MRKREYRLIQISIEVKNPQADRRVKSDWSCAPVIKAGTKFILIQDWEYAHLEYMIPVMADWGHQRIPLNKSNESKDSLARLILDSSRPIDVSDLSTKQLLSMIDLLHFRSASSILEFMCEENPIIRNGLFGVIDRMDAADEADEAQQDT